MIYVLILITLVVQKEHMYEGCKLQLLFNKGASSSKPAPLPLKSRQSTAPIFEDDDLAIVEPNASATGAAGKTHEEADSELSEEEKRYKEELEERLRKRQQEHEINSEKITVKVRYGDGESTTIRMKKREAFAKLAAAIAEKLLRCDSTKVKLMFDGENIDLNSTPLDYNMEDDDQIDASVKK
jgi:hypothetical protein